jgi:hypothetical protein
MASSLLLDGSPLSPVQEQNSWPFKAVLATRGQQTLLGCIVLNLICRQPKNPPMVASLATVDEKGLCWAYVVSRSGEKRLTCLGLITDIRDEFRRLADHLKLDDGERVELFDELRKWVSIDMRADHDEMNHSGQTTH